MPYSVLFLDMDHTLCDTALADEKGAIDFAEQLKSLGLSYSDDAINFTRYYLGLLYQAPNDFIREEGEDELNYRARLLQFALLRRHHLSLMMDRCRELVSFLMAQRMAYFDFFEGVEDMLRELRQQYKLIVISNGPLYSQEPKAQRVQLSRHVDHVILAGNFPWQKPDPRIFQHALDLGKWATHEVLHIGDSLGSDIAGAVASNIPCVWINPERRKGPREPLPNWEIANICELPQLLKEIDEGWVN